LNDAYSAARPIRRDDYRRLTIELALDDSHMSRLHTRTDLEEDFCSHIFIVSAAMGVVCLTVIGILRIVITIRKTDSSADELSSASAVLFLVAYLDSYWALRTRSTRRMHKAERFADISFIVAMCTMVFTCVLITFSIAVA
jgi:hypothetical protein